jgi:hypothetical protein
MRALRQQQAWSKQYRRKEEHRTEGTEKKKQKELMVACKLSSD